MFSIGKAGNLYVEETFYVAVSLCPYLWFKFLGIDENSGIIGN